MATDNYIVEGTNWKCRVSLERNSDQDHDYRLIEAATRCIEHLFGGTIPNSSVDVIELIGPDGVDFFKSEVVDEDNIPDPAFGLLIKIYNIKDAKKEKNHYVIRTKLLMENASAYDALKLAVDLETEIKEKNPAVFNSLEKILHGSLVFRYGDLKDIQSDGF
jgi:hypothetical protein